MLKPVSQFRVSATRLAIPPTSQTAKEIAGLLDRDETWIHNNVGVSTRYVSKPGDDPAVLAAAAARSVIEKCGEPDLLIYSSASVRQCIPDTSVFVARELGLNGVPAFSLNASCLSFLVAIQNGAALIESGSYQKILVVSAEQPTLSRNFSDPESAALFGDGAAAAMLVSTERSSGLIHFKQQTWPEFAELARVRGGGLLHHPSFESTTSSDYLFEMNGEELLRAALPRMKKFLREFFSESGVKIEDLNLIVPHQASAAGMKLLERVGIPSARTVNILSELGNCVSASMPMAIAIAEQEGRLKEGDLVLLLGSAAGLSIGAAVVRW